MERANLRAMWPEIVIQILRILIWILGLLSAGAGTISVVQGAGMPLLSTPATNWFWILLGATIVLLAAGWAFDTWRKGHQEGEDELLDQIVAIIGWLLDALQEETGKLLREIPQSVVEQAAREVYRHFIAGTPLAFVPEEVFVQLVVEQWRRIAGVQALSHRIATSEQLASE